MRPNPSVRPGGLDGYIQTYIAVAKALKAVIPQAGFGPSNMAGINAGQGCAACSSLDEFADRVKSAGAPLDFVAASTYSRWDSNGFAPPANMEGPVSYLRTVAERAGNPDAPVEVHEWGWAGWGDWNPDFGHVFWPEGAWSGAWALGSYLYQRKGGASRVFHWKYGFDSTLNRGVRGHGGNASGTCSPGTAWKHGRPGTAGYCRARGYPLVTAWGWLLSALLQAAPEREAAPPLMGRVQDNLELSEIVTDIPATAFQTSSGAAHTRRYNHTVGAIKAMDAQGGILSYLIMHFSPDPIERLTRHFRLEVSRADLQGLRLSSTNSQAGDECAALRVRQQALNKTTCVHDLIEEELYRTHQLVKSENRSVDKIEKMATPEGLAMLVADAPHWMKLNRQSMVFKPFDGSVGVDGAGGGCALEFDLETPSLLLLKISKS